MMARNWRTAPRAAWLASGCAAGGADEAVSGRPQGLGHRDVREPRRAGTTPQAAAGPLLRRGRRSPWSAEARVIGHIPGRCRLAPHRADGRASMSPGPGIDVRDLTVRYGSDRRPSTTWPARRRKNLRPVGPQRIRKDEPASVLAAFRKADGGEMRSTARPVRERRGHHICLIRGPDRQPARGPGRGC